MDIMEKIILLMNAYLLYLSKVILCLNNVILFWTKRLL